MEHKFRIGKVQAVDTGQVSIVVEDDVVLNSIQVNQLIVIRSSKTGEAIVGLVSKIVRTAISEKVDHDPEPEILTMNLVRVNLVGTFIDKEGTKEHVFKRTLNTVPSIDADCFLLQNEELASFMNIISNNNEHPLSIGKYTLSEDSVANIDGNKFFQRHATIIGSTGSGKSCTVANLLEKASKLKSINAVLFDLHGEYTPLSELDNTRLLKIAGPSDLPDDSDVVFLPYWLLSYEEMESMLLDRSDNNAPNQARALFDLIIQYKKDTLEREKKKEELMNFTVESPIPFDINNIVNELDRLDKESIPGSRGGTKQGPLHGKLTRFVQRLKSKQMDKRLNFMFNDSATLQDYNWLYSLINSFLDFREKNGLKIINFSEVPSDILPLVTGLVARLIFLVQQWMSDACRHPIALFCDEAHLYIPSDLGDSIEASALKNFQRIAKEGRKYGISLIVISQRPSDVNKTVLSQCGNFIAMRLTNPDDQNVIKRLFPDNLGSFSEILPILDIGEGLIVGDASLLPSRVKIDMPNIEPNSSTVDFWDEWSKTKSQSGINEAIVALRQQQKTT